MSRAPTDPEKLAAAIQELEAERRRREDERVAAGTAIRLPLLVVVHPGEDEAEAIERAKALTPLGAEGFHGEVLFEEPELIFTGVPRNDDFGKWDYKLFEPQYPTRYAATTTIRPRKGDDDIAGVPEPAPSEWKPVRAQVVAPNENSGHPGTVIEGEYAAVGSEVQVKYQGRVYAEAIKPGDDPVAVARRLLRVKWDSHGAFHDPIHYPPRSYH